MKWRGAPLPLPLSLSLSLSLAAPWQHRHSTAAPAAAEWITSTRTFSWMLFSSSSSFFFFCAEPPLVSSQWSLRKPARLVPALNRHRGRWPLATPSALIWDQLLTSESHHRLLAEIVFFFCNNLLWGAKSWCRYRIGFSRHRENFSSRLPPFLFLDVCQRDRASLGN